MTLDGRISITPQALYAMANGIEEHATQIEANVLRASQKLNTLAGNDVFQGESALVLLWRYNNMRGQMFQWSSRIRAYAQRIRAAGEAIELADQRSAGGSAPMCVAPTFLANGGAWIIRRKDGKTSYFYRDRDGNEYPLPEGFTPEQGLQMLDKFGDYVLGGLKDVYDLKLQHVRASERAGEYMRHFAGWSDISKSLKWAGYSLDAGLITYAGYRWAVGENGDYYESADIGKLNNGTQIVYDRYVTRDADEDFFGGLGSVGGGLLAAGAAAYIFGAPVTVPATIAVGAFTFVAGLIGGNLGEQGAKSLWRATFDYDPAPPVIPTTDLRFTPEGVEGRAAYQSIAGGGRIDLERLIEGDGEVVFQRDAKGHLVATGGVTGAPISTVYLE